MDNINSKSEILYLEGLIDHIESYSLSTANNEGNQKKQICSIFGATNVEKPNETGIQSTLQHGDLLQTWLLVFEVVIYEYLASKTLELSELKNENLSSLVQHKINAEEEDLSKKEIYLSSIDTHFKRGLINEVLLHINRGNATILTRLTVNNAKLLDLYMQQSNAVDDNGDLKQNAIKMLTELAINGTGSLLSSGNLETLKKINNVIKLFKKSQITDLISDKVNALKVILNTSFCREKIKSANLWSEYNRLKNYIEQYYYDNIISNDTKQSDFCPCDDILDEIIEQLDHSEANGSEINSINSIISEITVTEGDIDIGHDLATSSAVIKESMPELNYIIDLMAKIIDNPTDFFSRNNRTNVRTHIERLAAFSLSTYRSIKSINFLHKEDVPTVEENDKLLKLFNKIVLDDVNIQETISLLKVFLNYDMDNDLYQKIKNTLKEKGSALFMDLLTLYSIWEPRDHELGTPTSEKLVVNRESFRLNLFNLVMETFLIIYMALIYLDPNLYSTRKAVRNLKKTFNPLTLFYNSTKMRKNKNQFTQRLIVSSVLENMTTESVEIENALEIINKTSITSVINIYGALLEKYVQNVSSNYTEEQIKLINNNIDFLKKINVYSTSFIDNYKKISTFVSNLMHIDLICLHNKTTDLYHNNGNVFNRTLSYCKTFLSHSLYYISLMMNGQEIQNNTFDQELYVINKYLTQILNGDQKSIINFHKFEATLETKKILNEKMYVIATYLASIYNKYKDDNDFKNILGSPKIDDILNSTESTVEDLLEELNNGTAVDTKITKIFELLINSIIFLKNAMNNSLIETYSTLSESSEPKASELKATELRMALYILLTLVSNSEPIDESDIFDKIDDTKGLTEDDEYKLQIYADNGLMERLLAYISNIELDGTNTYNLLSVIYLLFIIHYISGHLTSLVYSGDSQITLVTE